MVGAMSRHHVIAVAISSAMFIHCGSPLPSPGGGDDHEDPAGNDAQPDVERPVPGLASVWAVHDGEKVERDDLAHPARNGNTAWRDGTVRIFGGRNEIVAFQVVAESDAAGITGLDVRLPTLSRRDGGGAITYAPPSDDPSDTVGRPIQIFTENYMNVTEPTQASWIWKPGGPAAPADTLGWKPVQLVPENARAGRGGLPIDVPPARNQAIWIEVYIPHGLPPGIYNGAVELRAGGGLRRVPVELEVSTSSCPTKAR